MRAILALAAAIFVGCLLAASSAHSEEPALDTGIATPLEVACATLVPVGQDGGMEIKSCRRTLPDEIVGNTATVHIRIATDQGVFMLDVHLQKSLWNVGSWLQK